MLRTGKQRRRQNAVVFLPACPRPACAVFATCYLCGDVLQTEIKGFQSVAQYYNAIPIKHKYVRKYRDKSQDHLIVDESVGKKLRSHLAKYLRTVKEHKLTGFIGKYASEGNKLIASYPIDCIGLQEILWITQEKSYHKFNKKY